MPVSVQVHHLYFFLVPGRLAHIGFPTLFLLVALLLGVLSLMFTK